MSKAQITAAAAARQGQPPTNVGEALPLSKKHLRDLRASGLSDDTIREAGLYTERDAAKVAALLGWGRGAATVLGKCLIFPFYGPDGKQIGHAQAKPDQPLLRDGADKPPKYESPRDAPSRVYFPPTLPEGWLADTGTALIVTEGVKKALAATQAGFPCLALAGVWNWKKKGKAEPLPDLARLNLHGRRVFIIYDSDAATNENVRLARKRLAQALTAQGAAACVVDLPAGPAGEKVGLDDLLVQEGGKEKLTALLGAACGRRPAVLPYRPFPLHALPPAVLSYVRATAEAIGCDPALVAVPALAALAGAIGNTYTIHLKDGWTEPSILWTATVSLTSTLKSPAFRAAVNPLKRAQMILVDKHKALVTAWKAQTPQYQRNNPGKAPPPLRRFVAGDATVQAVAGLLDTNPRGLLVAPGELDVWLQGFTRYAGGSSDRASWLDMYNADHLNVDRKGKDSPPIFVRRAAVSITGTIQPRVLARAFTEDAHASGLAGRLFLTMPPETPRVWTDNAVETRLSDRYLALICRLLCLEYRDEEGWGPIPCWLDSKAHEIWVSRFDAWNAERPAGELRAVHGKLEAGAARLALLHHVCADLSPPLVVDTLRELEALESGKPTSLNSDQIGPLSMQAGIEMAQWFFFEAQRIYAAIRETSQEQAERVEAEQVQQERERLIRWGRRQENSRATARRLQRSYPTRYPTVEAAEEALEELRAAGAGEWETCPPGPKGGRPKRSFNFAPSTPTPRKVSSADTDETSKTSGNDEVLSAKGGANGEVSSARPKKKRPVRQGLEGLFPDPEREAREERERLEEARWGDYEPGCRG